MKRCFYTLIFLSLIFANVLLAQNDSLIQYQSGIDKDEIANYITGKKVQVNVEFGTYFSTSSSMGSGFGTYVAPQISYLISPRFRLSSGIKTFQTTGLSYYETSPFIQPYPFSGNSFGSLVYVKGDYRLTDNIMISGTAFKQVDLFRMKTNGIPDPNFNYQGVIMGIDYQLGEHFFIRGEVEFSNGGSMHRMNSLYPNHHLSNSPFFGTFPQ